jgi:hypothetical protein
MLTHGPVKPGGYSPMVGSFYDECDRGVNVASADLRHKAIATAGLRHKYLCVLGVSLDLLA